MRIGVIADIHATPSSIDRLGAELQPVIDRFNHEFHPDLTVVLGDLIQEVGSPETDRETFGRAVEILDQIDSPIRYILGNHDVASLSVDEVRTLVSNDLYGVDIDDAFIFLDSSAPRLPDGRGEISENQLALLEQSLPRMEEGLLFVHHPIHYQDVRDNYWFDEYPEEAFCGNKRAINDLLDEYGGVQAVFNAHLHETAHVRYRGRDHFTINSFNKELVESETTGGFAEITLSENILRVRSIEGDGRERIVQIPP